MRLVLCLLVVLSVACREPDPGKEGPDEVEGDEAGECSDEADNDLNGLFDCDDPSCAGSPACDPGSGTDEPVETDCAPSTEECNGVDDDCDGEVDEANAVGCSLYYRDADADGWGVATDTNCLCEPDWIYRATTSGDCDDGRSDVSPGQAQDVCNLGTARDDDCDQLIDEDAPTICDEMVFGGPNLSDDVWFPLANTGIKGRSYLGHAGNARDFAAGVGTGVYAAGNGRVSYVAALNCPDAQAPNTCSGGKCVHNPPYVDCHCGGSYGNRVEIDHFDGSRTLYAHLTPGSILVEEGDVVCAGQQIAAVGATGHVCSSGTGNGAHLHFEYTDSNGTDLDPLPGAPFQSGGTCTQHDDVFEDCAEHRGGKKFSDECAEIDQLHASGILAWDCAALRADNDKCDLLKAPTSNVLGELVDVPANSTFGQCDATCTDMSTSDWFHDWIEAMNRLERGDGITVFDDGAQCNPAAEVTRAEFLRALMEAAGFATQTTSAGVPDISDIPSHLQPYVHGAVAAGLISSTDPIRVQQVVDYGWAAKVMTAALATGSLSVSDSDFATCGPIGSITVLYPDGGETFVAGETATLTWSSTDTSGTVKIEFFQGPNRDGSDTLIVSPATSLNDTGSYAGMTFLSNDFPPGSNYYMCVSDTDGSPWDCGDHFTVNAAASPCSLPWGGTIADGQVTTAYQAASACGSCTSETRTCNNGTLLGSYAYQSCTLSCSDCALPWGGTIQHGQNTQAFLNTTEPCGGACQPQTRTCDNGTLTGSYTRQSCSVNSCPCTCTDNDGDGWYAGTCNDTTCTNYSQDGDCDDSDALRYPGMTELWDIRDNDCDGQQDENGRRRLYRSFRDWPDIVADIDGDGSNETYRDWEHRFRTSTPAGFADDGHWMEIYPVDLCTDGVYAPQDGCSVSNGVANLWGGYALAALAECVGTEPSGLHVSFYVTEGSPDHGKPGYSCQRVGFVATSASTCNDLGASCDNIYRLASAPFDGVGVSPGGTYAGGIMWGADPNEAPADYPSSAFAFYALATSGW